MNDLPGTARISPLFLRLPTHAQRPGLALVIALTLLPGSSSAQQADAERRAAPSSTTIAAPSPQAGDARPPLVLTLPQALAMGREQNLQVLVEEQRLHAADGVRRRMLAGLLPDISGTIRQTAQKTNLAAYGFSLPGMPGLVGPFPLFDARLSATERLVDVSAFYDARDGRARLEAARFGYDDARRLVDIAVTSAYLQAVAARARATSVRAQLATADALYTLAVDQHAAGLVAKLEPLRADVQRKAAAQRVIHAELAVARTRATLGRAIGLSAETPLELSDALTFVSASPLDLTTSVTTARERRPDVRQARARVDAAQAALSAARAASLPSLLVAGDYGWIGRQMSTALGTYAVSALLRVPLFSGGQAQARVIERQAELRQREAELRDLERWVAYDVDLAVREVDAAAQQYHVATAAVAAATEALDQSRDRFRAGVGTNIDLVQAQEALASAEDAVIASLFAHNLARAVLARTIGIDEEHFLPFLKGQLE